jgi:hypothetical protein
MRKTLLINDIYRTILKHKYYVILAIILSIIFTSLHFSIVNKKYLSEIKLRLSPEYLLINKKANKSKEFNIYATMFKEEFFKEKNLINFLDPKYLDMTRNLKIKSGVRFQKNNKVKIELKEDLINIKINSNDIIYVKNLLDYIRKINFKLAREIIEQNRYFLININEILKKENTLKFSTDDVKFFSFQNLYSLTIEQKNIENLEKYILKNNMGIFSINYPTVPELVYPIKFKLFINYFIFFVTITVLILYIIETRLKPSKKISKK